MEGVLEEEVGGFIVSTEELEEVDIGEVDLLLLQPSWAWLFKFSKLGEVKTGDFIISFPLSSLKYLSIGLLEEAVTSITSSSSNNALMISFLLVKLSNFWLSVFWFQLNFLAISVFWFQLNFLSSQFFYSLNIRIRI